MKVMRLKSGDTLQVFTLGKKWECLVQQISPEQIHLKVLQEFPVPARSLHLILGQAIPKGDRFEWLIEKATEIGVAEIYPLITERTIVKPENAALKVQRWNEIAEQAAGQSENSFPTIVHSPLLLPSYLERTVDSGLKLLLHERKDSRSLRAVLESVGESHLQSSAGVPPAQTRRPRYFDINRITFVVGPEGGWTESETEKLLGTGYQPFHLGPRILRVETSGLVLATLLQYELGDFRNSK
ncbi:16S rRNA (uracil(1498)-N(3))-methyltransferase [bacterium]|nr:16S rRNA (uracil(1498)-N(3))-methyltransferase [bacterium]MCI0602848.1 16S rRNA (uracil(1498)-N(3))-methyltransferase [bacterium]